MIRHETFSAVPTSQDVCVSSSVDNKRTISLTTASKKPASFFYSDIARTRLFAQLSFRETQETPCVDSMQLDRRWRSVRVQHGRWVHARQEILGDFQGTTSRKLAPHNVWPNFVVWGQVFLVFIAATRVAFCIDKTNTEGTPMFSMYLAHFDDPREKRSGAPFSLIWRCYSIVPSIAGNLSSKRGQRTRATPLIEYRFNNVW